MLVSELGLAHATHNVTTTPTDAQTTPTEALSVSPELLRVIALANASSDKDDEDNERILQPRRLTVAEKFANTIDTQVRPVHLFES